MQCEARTWTLPAGPSAAPSLGTVPGPGPGPSPGPGPDLNPTQDIAGSEGLAAVVQTRAATVLKPPIVLMHGAIQGGWVWNYSRPAHGAPQVRY
jgi:hypothetical protein